MYIFLFFIFFYQMCLVGGDGRGRTWRGTRVDNLHQIEECSRAVCNVCACCRSIYGGICVQKRGLAGK